MTGTRKSAQTFKAQLVLLAGFIVAAFGHVPSELFWAFVVAVTGNLGAFVWGNVRVHQTQVGGVNGQTKENT